jgi:MYXO-CTERM domain-containing protein
MRWRVLLLFSIALLGNWGSPILVSPTVSTGDHAVERSSPNVARYDGGYLVSWQDGRQGRPFDKVYVTRVTSAGAVVDLAGIPISPRPLLQDDPASACIDTRCVVAWQQARDGVQARTIDVGTGALGPIFSVLPQGAGNGSAAFDLPSVASDGLQYLLAWNGEPGNIAGNVLRQDGSPTLSANRLLLDHPGQSLGRPVVTSWVSSDAGTRYLVAGKDLGSPGTQQIVARVFDTALAPIAPQVVIGTWAVRNEPLSATAVPGGFVLAWSDSAGRVAMRRITSSGVLSEPVPVNPFGPPNSPSNVRLASDSRGVTAVWFRTVGNAQVLEGGRLFHDGGVDVPASQLVEVKGDVEAASISSLDREEALLVWSATNLGESPTSAVFANVLTSSAFGVSSSDGGIVKQVITDVAEGPRVAAAAAGWLVSNDTYTGIGGTVTISVLDSLGAIVSSALAEPITPGHRGHDLLQSPPLLVWSNSGGVKVASIGPAATVGAPRVVGAGFRWTSAPSIAARPTEILIAWNGEDSMSQRGLFIATTDLSGQLLRGPTLAVSGQNEVAPSVVATATQYGIVWQSPLRLYRVSAGGVVTPSAFSGNGTIQQARIGSNGSDFFAVWSFGYPGYVEGQRISGAGTPIGPRLRLSNPTTPFGYVPDPSMPAVVFDGTQYVVDWSEASTDGGGLEVLSRAVSVTGVIGPIDVIAGGSDDQSQPAGAVGNSSRDVAHVWLQNERSLGVARTFIRLWTSDAGLPDAGSLDAGSLDAGSLDAGSLDAGSLDAGSLDAGSLDAGPLDAGPSDTGVLDAAVADAGDSDALDAGRATLSLSVGCGCTHTGATNMLLALALFGFVRRRLRNPPS